MDIEKVEKEWEEYIQRTKENNLNLADHKAMAMRVGELIQELNQLKDEKKKHREKNKKRPPINPNRKPTTVDIDNFSSRLRAKNKEALRRVGIRYF